MVFRVTYSGNGFDGGAPPVPQSFNAGDTVNFADVATIISSSSMTKTGAVFAYWNTSADGNGAIHGWPQDTSFIMPAANVELFAQWFVSAGLTNGGATKHYKFYYDSSLQAGGVEPKRTNELVEHAEVDFEIMAGWFAGVKAAGPSQLPIYVTRLTGGANNSGDFIRLKPGGNTSNELRSLLVSEMTESFMQGQNKGWGFLPGVNNEESCGEALSLFLTQQFAVQMNFPNPYTSFTANTADTWLNTTLPQGQAGSARFSNGTDFGARKDYVNTMLPFPGNGPGTGCSMLFLYYLYSQLGFSINEIIAAAPGSGKADTLREVYRALTGESADPFPRFSELLNAAYPQDRISRISGTRTGNPDDPFPLAPRPAFKDIFSGGNGVVYGLMDNGDLLWFRHDGKDDGSFRWATGRGRKVGNGWDFKAVFPADNGVIYAITHTGDLLWFRHDGRGDGSFNWAADHGLKVGTGWDFRRVFAGDNGVIYAITHTGDLLWFRHDGRGDGSFKWADDHGRKVGNGWDFKTTFSGGDGLIYAITLTGDLLWFRHDGRGDGSFRWADDHGRKVGNGWTFKGVFSGGQGLNLCRHIHGRPVMVPS